MTSDDRRPPPRGEAADAPLVVVLGVSGSGKTTIGVALANRLGLPYADGDNFHSPANIAKMRAGTPLDDEDRWPWLDAVGTWLARHRATGGVVSCSALKRHYRDRLATAAPGVFFIHLDGSQQLISDRLGQRRGHFMPPGLLQSQFADLERLASDEPGATVSIEATPHETVDRALLALHQR
ncbi:gluconokinase [Streptomyces sp. TP-A0874]|uniref:gluconokinase n=1 Tax=Streptomyces sp. TP-A0874 TaxID=549819 RepID=UPI000852F759|nr:gluconokinase [Streptomyces sp. TP-A0874]